MTGTQVETLTLSIVIPVFNAAATLGEQLDALLANIDEGMEIVIVDNGSTDRSRELAERFATEHESVRVVDASDQPGEAHARNEGVAAARCDAIAFCDADDVVAVTWPSAMRSALADAEYVTGPVELDRLNPAWLADVRGRKIFDQMPRTVRQIPFAHGCNIGVQRSLVRRIGGFDVNVRIGTDVDFAIRASHAGAVLRWTDGAVVHYRHRVRAVERFRQAVAYGRAAQHLHEVAGEPWGLVARARRQLPRLAWLIKTCPQTIDRGRRTRWLWTLALVIGELRGAP